MRISLVQVLQIPLPGLADQILPETVVRLVLATSLKPAS